ncbi:MAG TPA: hypothetical protein VG095_08200 [Chthoniobacterales bacterium]|nr:hypothetical protein [Chthoniobacterales bacterium]
MRAAIAVGAVLCLLCAARSHAISFGQADTYQDGTTMGWRHGSDESPNPPTNIATGGPAGTDDRYLRNISSGSGREGSKHVMFNTAQWIGNYNAAGVDRITMHMANFGSTTLYMRIAFEGGGSYYSSSTAAVLPPDAVWRPVTFDLTPSGMTSVSGTASLSQVLGSVTQARILSAIGGPAFTGAPIAGTLGVDNIVGRDIGNSRLRVTDLARPAGGAPQINFTTINGRTHRVERNDSFNEAGWTALSNATTIVGTGGVMQVTDNDPTTSALRLYRVVLLP